MLNPLVAVRLILTPAHTWLLDWLILRAGLLLTVTLAVAVALQLLLLVAVTVNLKPPALLLLNVALAALLLNVPPLLAQA